MAQVRTLPHPLDYKDTFLLVLSYEFDFEIISRMYHHIKETGNKEHIGYGFILDEDGHQPALELTAGDFNHCVLRAEYYGIFPKVFELRQNKSGTVRRLGEFHQEDNYFEVSEILGAREPLAFFQPQGYTLQAMIDGRIWGCNGVNIDGRSLRHVRS